MRRLHTADRRNRTARALWRRALLCTLPGAKAFAAIRGIFADHSCSGPVDFENTIGKSCFQGSEWRSEANSVSSVPDSRKSKARENRLRFLEFGHGEAFSKFPANFPQQLPGFCTPRLFD